MKFENAFAVHAPVDEVWAALMDVERVAPCMPGAEVLERTGDDAYKVGVKVKIGPISMLYRGQVEIVERDDATHRATMRARAKEARGQGTADADVRMSLVEQPDGAQATIETELALSGRAASMGQGVIGDVAEKLIDTFAGNLAGMLAAGAAPAASGTTPPPEPAPAQDAAHAAEAGPAPGPAPSSVRPPADASLPVGEIAASVIAGRLRNPRTLLLAVGAVALASGALGYAIGRAR
jgi:carbon monoxide dehydrogenase subunit G